MAAFGAGMGLCGLPQRQITAPNEFGNVNALINCTANSTPFPKKVKKTRPSQKRHKTPVSTVKPSSAIAGQPASGPKRSMGDCGGKLSQTH